MIREAALDRPVSARPAAGPRVRLSPATLGGYAILTLLALLYLIPLMFVFFVSLMSGRQFALNAASFPDPILWSNYPEAWVKGSFGTYFVNSLTYTVAIVAGSLIIATLAAFPIARGHIRWSNGFYILFLSGILLPAGIIPQFFILQQLGLYNTKIGYILLWWSRIALPIFILSGFIKTIPTELDDAAAIDGCNEFGIFFRIIVPLITPALVTAAIFSFYFTWGDFLHPLIYLNDPQLYTISVALRTFADPSTVTNWGAIFAMSTLALVPVFVVFIFFQRYLIEGITLTGLKE